MPLIEELIREPVTINTWSTESWGPGQFRATAVLTFNVTGTFIFAAGHRLMSGCLNSWAYNQVEVRGQAGDRIPVSVQYSMDSDHTATCGVWLRPEDVPTAISFGGWINIMWYTGIILAVCGGGLVAALAKGIK